MNKRESGILMHISSLSNEFGIGSLGDEAYDFIDFLRESGQRYWQVLPLGHTGFGNSPYQCFSTVAGNPNFINLEALVNKGLICKTDYKGINFGIDPNKVDYEKVFEERRPILYKAYEKFKSLYADTYKYHIFEANNKDWLEDYSNFMAIKEYLKMKPLKEWPDDIRYREKPAIEYYKSLLKDRIDFYKFLQYEFFNQWNSLRDYAASNEVAIIGDIPIYVPEDSVDMWVTPHVFKVDENHNPTFISGCPPDYFSEDGQVWGTPVYDWEYLAKYNYNWWIDRIDNNLLLYDVLRLDHFIGFNSFWQIPYGAKTAKDGEWIKGPGIKLFNEIRKRLGNIEIIAEDLGVITEEFLEFKKQTGFRGMKVLQFAFGQYNSENLPYHYETNSVAYVGTHDNETAREWFELNKESKEGKLAKEFLEIGDDEDISFRWIRAIWNSPSNIAIATMQDILEIGQEGRMNRPSTLSGNWSWRMQKDSLTKDLAKRLYRLTKLSGRIYDEDEK
ncbi:MAG: 4-alpha-glucanotransferase [Sarcina sp.]